jgi:hypothetical protein
VGGNGFAECSENDGAGDAAMRGDRQGVAGVVVDEVEDLDVGVIGEPPVVKSACQRSLGCSAAKPM